jgi:hypothetical protein
LGRVDIARTYENSVDVKRVQWKGKVFVKSSGQGSGISGQFGFVVSHPSRLECMVWLSGSKCGLDGAPGAEASVRG